MINYLFTKTPLAFFTMDLWRDEAFSFVMAKQGVMNILRTSAQDFAPPFYYIVLHYWMMIFGTSEIAMRSLSFLTYALLLFVIFEIMVLVFKISMKRALWYFLLFLANPFLNFYAFEARMYMMAALFVTLSYFALWSKKRILYIVALSLALYTHYFTIFILIAQIISYYFSNSNTSLRLWRSTPLIKRRIIPLLKRGVAQRMLRRGVSNMFILPILLFLPWLIYVGLNHDFSDARFWIIQPLLTDIFYTPFMLFTGYERVFGEYYHGAAGFISFHTNINLMLIALLTLPIFFIKSVKKMKYLADLYLWAFLPALTLFILSFISTPVYLPRYVIASVPALLLLIIISFELLVLHAPKKRAWIPFALFGVVLFVTYSYNILNVKYHAKKHVSSMYKEVQAVRDVQDVIYLMSELDFHLAQYYIGNDVFIFGKSYGEIPQYVGKSLIPEAFVRQSLPLYPIKAFIIHYDWYEVRSLL